MRILKEVDYILCEDKRVTTRLLNKYLIKTKLISFHKFNEKDESDKVIMLLNSGNDIALVSDAGTPLIADPGYSLISLAEEYGIKVRSIPGPSSLTAALSVCPYFTNDFLFLGFLPEGKSKRSKIICSLDKKTKLVFLFIAPHDFKKYLNEIYEVYPEVEIFYSRELTKIYEEVWSGTIKDLVDIVGACRGKPLKGEIVLGLYFRSDEKTKTRTMLPESKIVDKIKNYIKEGFSLKETSKILSKEFDLSSRGLYDLYIRCRDRF